MNQALLEARRKFKGQKVELTSAQFDNTPIPEGKYIAEVVDAKIKDTTKTGEDCAPTHYMMLKIAEGECAGRSVWPYPPSLETVEGATQSAQYIRAILGDVIPVDIVDGRMSLKLDDYLMEVDELIHRTIGEMVEVSVVNRKARPDNSHINNNTGLPYQNTYINRGLGADKTGVKNTKEPKRVSNNVGSSMNVGSSPSASQKKKKKKIK